MVRRRSNESLRFSNFDEVASEEDDQGEIVKVHHNASCFEKEYNLKAGNISQSIHQNQKSFGITYKYIDEETYYQMKPIQLVFSL